MRFSEITTWRRLPSLVPVWLSVVSILAALTLSACSTTSPLVVDQAPLELERPTLPTLPLPQPIRRAEVEWRILTPETLPDGNSWAYFALTAEEYEELALAMADIRRWIQEAWFQLEYYGGRLDGPAD